MNLEKVAKSDAAQHCSETHQLLNAMANKYSPNRNISKLSFMCIGTTFEPYFQSAIEVYQQFLDVSGQHGQLFVAHDESDAHKSNHNGEQSNGANNGDIGDNGGATNTNGNGVAGVTPTSAQWKSETIPHLVGTMCEANYKPFEATLNCGDYHSLKATSILIWPSPMVGLILFWYLICTADLYQCRQLCQNCHFYTCEALCRRWKRFLQNDRTHAAYLWLYTGQRYWIADVDQSPRDIAE